MKGDELRKKGGGDFFSPRRSASDIGALNCVDEHWGNFQVSLKAVSELTHNNMLTS